MFRVSTLTSAIEEFEVRDQRLPDVPSDGLLGQHSMPAVTGFHPRFANALFGDSLLTTILPADAARRELNDLVEPAKRWVEPGNGLWDHCFPTNFSFELAWPGVEVRTVRSSGALIGVFNGEDSGTAIEPTTSPSGLLADVIEPGGFCVLQAHLERSKS